MNEKRWADMTPTDKVGFVVASILIFVICTLILFIAALGLIYLWKAWF